MPDTENADNYGYSMMSADDLKNIIIEVHAQNLKLADDKKHMADGFNAIIKENKKRISVAMAVLKEKQVTTTTTTTTTTDATVTTATA